MFVECGWTVAAPNQESLDPALICGIGPRLEALNEANAHAVVIARHGRLVYERYFAGNDQRQSMSLGVVSFDAATKHDMRSISKSVTSLLVGIAFDRGLLTDLDASAFSFFPEYEALRTPEKDRITLRHLLTMSSGLAWDEIPYTDPSSSYRQMEVAPRADHYVLAQPLAELMKAAGKKYEPVIYKGAGHGFMRSGEPNNPAVREGDKKARDEAWARWKKLLAEL